MVLEKNVQLFHWEDKRQWTQVAKWKTHTCFHYIAHWVLIKATQILFAEFWSMELSKTQPWANWLSFKDSSALSRMLDYMNPSPFQELGGFSTVQKKKLNKWWRPNTTSHALTSERSSFNDAIIWHSHILSDSQNNPHPENVTSFHPMMMTLEKDTGSLLSNKGMRTMSWCKSSFWTKPKRILILKSPTFQVCDQLVEKLPIF